MTASIPWSDYPVIMMSSGGFLARDVFRYPFAPLTRKQAAAAAAANSKGLGANGGIVVCLSRWGIVCPA